MKSYKFDTRWILSLFGTAVGAGILYLPIRAGTGGFWPVVAMGFVIFPMVYLSHRALSRFVSQASGADKDITHAAEEYFGRNTALFISVLYFFAIFPICLAYCVGISNTFESFIYHQFLPLASAD
ncbi:aromatic amino acid transport family protein, partial [Campylobacter helveticus]